MKRLCKKNLTQKIIIIIVMILSFNFIAPTYSQADFGGVLMGPIIDLIAGIGDSVMALLEVFMDGGDNSLLKSEGFSVKSNNFNADDVGMGVSDLPADVQTKEIQASDLDQGWLWGTYSIPIIKYSPEKIFSNQVPALDANFIDPKFPGNEKSVAAQLHQTIASWYNALRNLVIVGLLSILLYVGIRIILTSTASDKAKYKKMLMDWLVALCLLFFLHYIMAFSMKLIETITDGISGATDVKVRAQIDNQEPVVSFKTNLTGLCRMQVQYKDLGERLIYLVFYVALVIYTFMFTWEYMKRAITLAFLTIIAPLVVLTYPIDKMGDGKAQAFGMWLKEYIFNALLQPFHLIIYTVFLGAGMTIVMDNPLYAILFLAFISPAEKILRKFFKFDQASTAGASFAGAFGGAAAYNMVKGLVSKGSKGGGGQGGSGSGQRAIRQQRQLTDPNAPDGSLTPFAQNRGGNNADDAGAEGAAEGVAAGAGAALASTNNQDNSSSSENEGQRPQPSLFDQSEESQRLSREREALNDLRGEATDAEDQEYLNQQQHEINESDQRGVLQWAKDSAIQRWDLGAKAQSFKRTVGNATKPVRDLAGRAKNTVAAGIEKAGETYRKLPKPLRNSLERTGRAGLRTIKGAAGVVKAAAPGAARLGGRALGAAAGLAFGTAVGITQGSLDDTITYGLGGAALGGSAGPALASNMANGISSTGETIRRGYEEGAYGTEEAALRQQDRDFVSNEQNREFFAEKLTEQTGAEPSRSELNQTMETAAEYNRAGITDLKQINKSMLLEQELQKELQSTSSMTEQEARSSARDQAITIAKIAQGVDAKDLRSASKVKDLQASFERELLSKDPSMGSEAAKAQASRIVELVKKQKKVY